MNELSGRKVLFVITKSNWGGAQAYVAKMAMAAKEAHAEVLVALGGTGEVGAGTGLLAEKLKEAGIRTVFLSSFARDISLFQEFRAFRELLKIIRKERPDVLQLNSSKAGGLGALAGRMAGVPRIIFTAHGWAHREPRSFPKRTAIWTLSYLTALLSHVVIVVSEKDYTDGLAFASKKKLHLIRNGIGAFDLLEKSAARRKLTERNSRLPLNGTWILAASELHPNKGIDVAIRAFAQIKDQHPDAVLVVLGEGQEREKLTALATELGMSDQVFLLGFVENAKSYLRAADIFILPSHKEGLPFALLEAGYAGLPVIASNTGGIPEVIQHNTTGFLVPPGNPDALTKAIATLLEYSATAIHCAQTLYTKILNEFSESQMIQKTFALF